MESNDRQIILDTLREFSTPERPVYLVGGAVRDLLLNRPAHDLDFVLPGATRGLAHEVACRLDGALYMLDEERDTTRVVLEANDQRKERLLLDFASLRAQDLDADLRARDFTINAMAVDVAQLDTIIDPTGGSIDLREKRVRACSADSLTNDPVRVLRAVRQALSLHFELDPETLRLMQLAAPKLLHPSAERLRDELFRMLDGSQVSAAVRLLDHIGALPYLLPELEPLKGVTQTAPHVDDVWNHTLAVVQALEQLLPPLLGEDNPDLSADPKVRSAVSWLGRFRPQFAEHFSRRIVADRSLRALLFFAALYHDISKPETRTATQEGRVRFLEHQTFGAKKIAQRGRALALSAAEVSRLETLVEHHMRVHFLSDTGQKGPVIDTEGSLSRRAIYRFFKDTGDAGVDICLLSLADVRGTYGAGLPQEAWESELRAARTLLEAFWEKSAEVVSPPRYLSGDDLMGIFGLRPGRLIGRLLGAIREAQAIGEIHDREEALGFARRWLDSHTAVEGISKEEGEG